jgi:hypothetical protein
MILYILERKLIRIIFKIQYYGPYWYMRKIEPYVDRYYKRPMEKYASGYIKYTSDWPDWAVYTPVFILGAIIIGLAYFSPKIVPVVVVFARPYFIFFFTAVFSPIIKTLPFFMWVFYYPILLLTFLHDLLIFFGSSFKWLVNKVMHDGVIASFKYVYFFIKSNIVALYTLLVLSEDGWLHFLVPNIYFLNQCFLILEYWFKKFWWSTLKYYIYFLLLRRFYRWYMYKVPEMDIEWFVDKGPTMLALYQLRVCPFKEVWALYKEKVYDFIVGFFMFIGYIFHLQILAFLKRYIRNVDGCRLTIKKRLKRKIRKPFIRILVKFHLLFLPFYYLFQYLLFYFFTAGKIFFFTFSKTLLVIAVLLFIVFLWINLHKFFFDYIVFFILNKLGYKFPRSTLYTQPTKTRASDFYSISRKFKSSIVSLRLNSLVDLKNTNVYSVYSNKLFSQLPANFYNTNLPKAYIRANLFRLLRLHRKKVKSKRFGFMNIVYRDSGVKHKPFGEWFMSPKGRINAKFHALETYTSRHFHFVDKFNLLHPSSRLRYTRLKGSLFLPKFTSNKFDVNTFVLKELLLLGLSNGRDNPSSSISQINNNLVDFFSSSKNLSVPSLGLFEKSDFFLFDKNFNKISSNRKSNLLSDLCYSFMGRYRFPLSKNSTLFYDSPIYRHRTGGNFRYKNVYSYDKRSIINGFKFLNNFKVLASFPRKRVRVYNPYATNRKAGSLLKRHFKFERVINKELYTFLAGSRRTSDLVRATANYLNLMGSIRLMRQFAALKLKDKRRIKFKFMHSVVAPRRGSRSLRKFFYKRFIYNKFNKNFSFYKKRQKIRFSKFVKNPKVAYVIKHNFSASRKRVVSSAVMPGSVSRRANRFNFLSFSSKLKSLRRNIIFLLRYRNNKKFFKHGTRFLIRSQLLSKKNQINKGRRLRRFFTRSNVYLSFLKSVYSRNVRLLLAVKSVSSAISDFSANDSVSKDFSYLPLFHVLEKPWWHDVSLRNNKDFSYFNFYSGVRSSAGKLGFTAHNSFGSYFNLLKRPRRYLGRSIITNRLLAKRYYYNKDGWISRRKVYASPYIFSDWRTNRWGRRYRIKRWFYKKYKVIPSILFINPSKDNRRFAFDYVFKYFHDDYADLSTKTVFASAPAYGGFGPLFLKFTFEFEDRYKYLRKLFIDTFRSYFNSLYIIFVFCLVFCSFPSDIQPYLL